MMALPSDAEWIAAYAILAAAWIGPIGLFVLRRRLAVATGGLAAAKVGLYFMSVLSAPVVLLTIGILIASALEALRLMWELLKWVW